MEFRYPRFSTLFYVVVPMLLSCTEQTVLLHPDLPLVHSLYTPLRPGMSIIINGSTTSGFSWFSLYLQDTRIIDFKKTTPLHLVYNKQRDKIVLNTYKMDQWAEEQHYHIHRGPHFEIQIRAEETAFWILFNKEHLAWFDYRLPLSYAKNLLIVEEDTGTAINNVTILGEKPYCFYPRYEQSDSKEMQMITEDIGDEKMNECARRAMEQRSVAFKFKYEHVCQPLDSVSVYYSPHFVRLPPVWTKCPCECWHDPSKTLIGMRRRELERMLTYTIVVDEWLWTHQLVFTGTWALQVELFFHPIDRGDCLDLGDRQLIVARNEFKYSSSFSNNFLVNIYRSKEGVNRISVKNLRDGSKTTVTAERQTPITVIRVQQANHMVPFVDILPNQ